MTLRPLTGFIVLLILACSGSKDLYPTGYFDFPNERYVYGYTDADGGTGPTFVRGTGQNLPRQYAWKEFGPAVLPNWYGYECHAVQPMTWSGSCEEGEAGGECSEDWPEMMVHWYIDWAEIKPELYDGAAINRHPEAAALYLGSTSTTYLDSDMYSTISLYGAGTDWTGTFNSFTNVRELTADGNTQIKVALDYPGYDGEGTADEEDDDCSVYNSVYVGEAYAGGEYVTLHYASTTEYMFWKPDDDPLCTTGGSWAGYAFVIDWGDSDDDGSGWITLKPNPGSASQTAIPAKSYLTQLSIRSEGGFSGGTWQVAVMGADLDFCTERESQDEDSTHYGCTVDEPLDSSALTSLSAGGTTSFAANTVSGGTVLVLTGVDPSALIAGTPPTVTGRYACATATSPYLKEIDKPKGYLLALSDLSSMVSSYPSLRVVVRPDFDDADLDGDGYYHLYVGAEGAPALDVLLRMSPDGSFTLAGENLAGISITGQLSENSDGTLQFAWSGLSGPAGYTFTTSGNETLQPYQ